MHNINVFDCFSNDYDADIKTVINHNKIDNNPDPVQSKRFISLAAHQPLIVSLDGPLSAPYSKCSGFLGNSGNNAASGCAQIRPPWFHRPLLQSEKERIHQEFSAAMKLGYNFRSSHNLRYTRVIIIDIGSSYYNNWEGDRGAASSKWFVDKYVNDFELITFYIGEIFLISI